MPVKAKFGTAPRASALKKLPVWPVSAALGNGQWHCRWPLPKANWEPYSLNWLSAAVGGDAASHRPMPLKLVICRRKYLLVLTVHKQTNKNCVVSLPFGPAHTCMSTGSSVFEIPSGFKDHIYQVPSVISSMLYLCWETTCFERQLLHLL